MVKHAGVWVLLVAIAGAALRVTLAFTAYPLVGDPVYSYAYRALLLADGQWHAVFTLWHLPGYPLLLGLLTRLGGGWLSPYAWGTIASVGCYLNLVAVIDRLVAPRARWPGTRIAVASFLAFYETLVVCANAPLTEPPYLLLLYTGVWVLDRERVGPARAAIMGILLGLACTIRLEAVAPFLGLALLVGVRAARGPGRPREAAGVAACALLGFLAAFGWLLLFPGYLEMCRKSQEFSYTIPPAHGVAGNLLRLTECAYYACTNWLPMALLLPYWLLLALGLTHPARAAGRAPLHGLLLAVTVPGLALVGATIMHKRTASFLLPAAGVWFGLGLEVLAVRFALGRTRRGVAVLLGAAVAFNLLQATRVVFREYRAPAVPDPASRVAARLLAEHAGVVGPVWAFGSEPEVYAFWGKPLYCSVWEGDAGYSPCYAENRHNPRGFVDAVRRSGCKYLTFVRPERPGPGDPAVERQPYGDVAGQPSSDDLAALVKDPRVNGLQLLGESPAERGASRVYLFKVLER